ncbi:MAG TPA: hypothetical protein VN721_04605 [Flavipsychrobacter sp.]|nr:hypothetical protein [Flavipsychrobacter sp.]
MRYFYISVIAILLFSASTAAAKSDKKSNETPPRTEEELINKILNCLQYQDSITYASLFPDFDTLWTQVVSDSSYEDYAEMMQLRQHPDAVKQFDPYYNHKIVSNFYKAIIKAKDSGIHWKEIVLRSYKLQKIALTRDLIGYEKIAPIRFQGYVFIRDMLARKNYVFAVNEMQDIKGYWYGGQVINIYPASSIDEYLSKQYAEVLKKKKMKEFGITEDTVKDSASIAATIPQDDDDDAYSTPKEVVDRKYYVGKFDNEIPVKLYVRYLRGDCPDGACEWQAIYKFGDQDKYVKLDVSKTQDGKWSFVEDPPIGYMDLSLKNNVYTGSWSTADNQTGYDVRLTQTDISNSEAQRLDEIIENKLWAKPKTDEEKDVDDEDTGYTQY